MVVERVTIYSTKPLNGTYRYRDVFQLFPSDEEPIMQGRWYYPINIEFSFDSEEPYCRYGIPYGSDELTRRIIEYHHLLSVGTQFFFFNFEMKKNPSEAFTKYKEKQAPFGKIKWYQAKSPDDRNIKEIVFPDCMDHFLDAYYSLDSDQYFTFRNSMYLYYSGIDLMNRYKSLSFASIISSLETLMNEKKEKKEFCESCGQQIFSVRQKYLQFVTEYAFDGTLSKDNKTFADKLYSLRCKFLHQGKLFLADTIWDNVVDSDKDWEEYFSHLDLISLARICLINWCVQNSSI